VTAWWIPPVSRRKQTLPDLLSLYRGESTTGKLVMMSRIREYIRSTDFYQVLDEIRQVDNEQDLNVLLGAGMRGQLWYEVVRQKGRCQET